MNSKTSRFKIFRSSGSVANLVKFNGPNRAILSLLFRLPMKLL